MTQSQFPNSVSVILPVYNGAKYIREALESLRNQGDSLKEILLIDDGSKDETLEISREYQNQLPLHFLDISRSGNWVKNTNLGIRESSGSFISILHQDDAWEPGRLQAFETALASFPEIDVFANPSVLIDARAQRVGHQNIPLPRNQLLDGPSVLQKLIVQNSILIPGVIFRKPVPLPPVGLLDESLWYTADWKLWLSLCLNRTWFVSSEMLTRFRIHPESLTIQGISTSGYREQFSAVLKEFLPILQQQQPKRYAYLSRRSIYSQEVNFHLASLFAGRIMSAFSLLRASCRLTPWNFCGYVSDSRINERTTPRLRLLFSNYRQNF